MQEAALETLAALCLGNSLFCQEMSTQEPGRVARFLIVDTAMLF